MNKEKICFLYTGAKEEEIAFEVWCEIADLQGSNPTLFANHWLVSNGYVFINEPSSYQVLPHTEWLAQMRPLEVGDTVEVLEDREWDLWAEQLNQYVGKQFPITKITERGYANINGLFVCRPHRLRLIKKGEKRVPDAAELGLPVPPIHTTWQPQEDVIKYPSVIGSIDISKKDGKRLMAALAIITTECRTNKTPDECIKEIDDLAYEMYKPKTLREEVREIINDKDPDACDVNKAERIINLIKERGVDNA